MYKQTIEKFVETVKTAEQTNQKSIQMSINDARNLSVALTKLLLNYTEAVNGHLNALERNHNEAVEAQQIEMDGGGF